MFIDELLTAYPNAKVILTQRDVDSWLISMDKTILELLSWKSFYYLAPFEPVGILSLRSCTPNELRLIFLVKDYCWSLLEVAELRRGYMDRW